MDKIKPQGDKLIVLPIEKTENHKTQGGIELVDFELNEGKVIEVSEHLSNVYSQGDIIVYPKNVGLSLSYQGRPHIWVRNDEVWGIKTN